MGETESQQGTSRQTAPEPLRMAQLFSFFIPLGTAAILVAASHSIINSTLARSSNPELIIASYAVAMSILILVERPALLLRQTCSALVRDKISFRAMRTITIYVLSYVLFMGSIIAYTPVGRWLFVGLMGIDESMLEPVLQTWRILMFVSIASGVRGLYHGIIIFNLRTKWLTIGMVIRLVCMYLLSVYFLNTNQVTSSTVGAIIFCSGMFIEAIVAFIEGRKLLKSMPEKKEDHPIENKGQIFQFYRPLIYSTFLAIAIGPAINAMLGKTEGIALAIASFAIAANVANLVQSFFSYMHQIVLNFYYKDTRKVLWFAVICGFLPPSLIAVLGYTPVGVWFLQTVMGVEEQLLRETIVVMRVFMIMTAIFPWLDFCNGILMLKGQTKIMLYSQAANVAVTLTTLIICVVFTPGWNGVVGSLAQSLGVAAELLLVLCALRAGANGSAKLNRWPRHASAK